MAQLSYKISLNGVELTNVAIGVTSIEKFEEPLDEGGLHLPFTAIDYQYEMRGLLTIYVDDGTDNLTFNYLILSDELSEGSKYGEWKHDLTVMEYTHKLDLYLIHSLVKTKSITNDNPAPFEIVETSYFSTGDTGTNDNSFAIDMGAWLEGIDIKTQYYDDETLTINQVALGYEALTNYSGTLFNYARVPAYVKAGNVTFDIDGTAVLGATVHAKEVVSTADVEWTFDKGKYYIEYGFVSDGTSTDVVIYRFYINVVERDKTSVYDLVDLVRQKISKFGGVESKLFYDETRIFDIDSTIETLLKSVEAPQTFIQKATARQVLNGIFQYINSISRLKYREDDLDLLSIDQFNDITDEFDYEDISSYGSQQDARNLGNKGVNWLEQILPNNLEEPTIKTPAQDNYKTVRSTNIQITDTTFELKLEKPIYQMKKFIALVHEVAFSDSDDPTFDISYDDFELDLTSRLPNKSEWDLKLITVNFPTIELQQMFGETVGLRENKVSNLYWQQGDTKISLADPYGSVVQINLVANVIREALNEHFTRYMIEPNIIDVSGTGYMQTEYLYNRTLTDSATFDYLLSQFNVEYITLENINAQVEREDLSYSPYYTETKINQMSKLLNITSATRKSYGELQRTGVPDVTFSKHHESLSDLLEVGNWNENGYVIVQRKLEFHNEYIYATYNATKDHNRIAQFIGLDQAYRWAEIPTSNQIYEAIESYTDYIVISDPDTTITAGTTKIESQALELMFGTLMNDWTGTSGKTKTTLAYVRTDGFLEIYPDVTYRYAVMTPVASFGIKNGLVFTFGFDNNQIAGVGVETSVVSSSTLYWNKATRYTNEQGTFDEFWFQLSSEYSNSSATSWTDEEQNTNYPLTRTTLVAGRYGLATDVYYKCGDLDFDDVEFDGLILYKDRAQSIKISYQNTFISKTYLEYIFGQYFSSENFLVKNPKIEDDVYVGTPMYLHIYENGTTYGKFEDLKVKTGYLTPKTLLEDGTNVSYTSRQFRFSGTIDLTDATSWAIGDDDGNLYLACNDNHNGFNVSEQHFRPDLLEIGKTE